jgi:hypothetical protein
MKTGCWSILGFTVRPRALCEAPFDEASGLPLTFSPTLWPISHTHPEHKMPLEDAMMILDVLTVIAKAVPVLGAPVEGSLEALGKILKLAQARRPAIRMPSFRLTKFRYRKSSLTRRRRRSSPIKLLAG